MEAAVRGVFLEAAVGGAEAVEVFGAGGEAGEVGVEGDRVFGFGLGAFEGAPCYREIVEKERDELEQ